MINRLNVYKNVIIEIRVKDKKTTWHLPSNVFLNESEMIVKKLAPKCVGSCVKVSYIDFRLRLPAHCSRRKQEKFELGYVHNDPARYHQIHLNIFFAKGSANVTNSASKSKVRLAANISIRYLHLIAFYLQIDLAGV